MLAPFSLKTETVGKQRWSIPMDSIRKWWEILIGAAMSSVIKRSRKLLRHEISAHTSRSYFNGLAIVEEFFWKTSDDTNLSQTTTFHNPGWDTQTEAGNPNLGCLWTSTGNSKHPHLTQKNLGYGIPFSNLNQIFRHSHFLPTAGVFESTH